MRARSLQLRGVIRLRQAQRWCVVACLAVSAHGWAAAPKVDLANGGRASAVILTAENTPPEVRALAAECAAGLERITGAKFPLVFAKAAKPADGTASIVLGLDTEWPGRLPALADGRSPVLARDDYLIRSESGRIWLLGRTTLGVQNAMWDFFRELGFRQFFPGPDWEIWPASPTLSFQGDRYEVPCYFTRLLKEGSGESPVLYDEWARRNRMRSGFELNTTHAYDAIIERHPQFFEAHPEAITSTPPAPGVKPARKATKLDPTVTGVLELIAQDSLAELRRQPGLQSLRMDPSDGGGWRTDSPLGSPSNQAVTVANYVAKAIQAEFPGRKVGMYAYGWHSPPPDMRVDPNVIVSVATAFLRDGNTAESLLTDWHGKGAEMGIREYLACWPWDFDLPGESRAASPDYIKTTIPHFYKMGVRYWTSDRSNGWGAHGPGFYLASRVLWDLKEADRIPDLLADFYNRSFGPAAGEMRDFYEHYILASGNPLLSEDLFGRMYRQLSLALEKAKTEDVTVRIYDLVAYTHYVELMFHFKHSPASARVAAYRAMAEFVSRGRSIVMFNTAAVLTRERDTAVAEAPAIKELMRTLPTAKPLAREELAETLRTGMASNAISPVEAKGFSSQLVPALQRIAEEPAGKALKLKGDNVLYVFNTGAHPVFEFKVIAGVIYADRGPARFKLFSGQNVIVDEAVAAAEVPPDKKEHIIRLSSPYSGLHRLEITAGGDRIMLDWPAGTRVALPAGPGEKAAIEGVYSADFFVPAKTTVVECYSGTPKGRMLSADGELVLNFAVSGQPGYFSVAVKPGQDGKYWRMVDLEGEKLLLTVPPFLSRNASELLVPQEVAQPPPPPELL